MNWSFVVPIAIAALVLIIFLFARNMKDKKKFEKQVENDYHKPRSEEGDIEIDEKTK